MLLALNQARVFAKWQMDLLARSLWRYLAAGSRNLDAKTKTKTRFSCNMMMTTRLPIAGLMGIFAMQTSQLLPGHIGRFDEVHIQQCKDTVSEEKRMDC